MAVNNGEMSILEHLGELRKRLIFIAVAIFIATIVCFFFVNQILVFLTRPVENMELIYTRPAEALMSQIRLAFIAGILVSLPFSLYQVMLFIIPALSEQEKKTIISLIVFMLLLFALGLLFGYYIALPFTLLFFLGFQTEGLVPFFTISDYISFVASFLFGFGFVFQLPLIFWFLGRIGLISSSFLKTNRKYAVLISAILAAIFTPPDVFSQILMLFPLLLLYEVGIMLVSISEKRRKKNS